VSRLFDPSAASRTKAGTADTATAFILEDMKQVAL